MAFDTPKRLQAGKSYKVGDLISLAGELGEETFDYPYYIVKKDFVASIYLPSNECVELVHPAWNEKMSYFWNEEGVNQGKYIIGGLVWKVWYKGILYEMTKWTKPTDIGIPPDRQVTNVGDNAGFQPNLNGEAQLFVNEKDRQKAPEPKRGFSTILKNQSHTFRSWIISEIQPSNPHWDYSSTLNTYVYNNYLGDETPESTENWEYSYYENSDMLQDEDYYRPLPPVKPFQNYLENAFKYQKNPNLYDFYVVYDGLFWDSDYPLERFQVSGEGLEMDYTQHREQGEYPDLNKEYLLWSDFGFNPFTGRMPEKDTALVNPYSPRTTYDYPWDYQVLLPTNYIQPSYRHSIFRSVHMFREGLQTKVKATRIWYSEDSPYYGGYYDSNESSLEVFSNAYPPEDQIFITAIQGFNLNLNPYTYGLNNPDTTWYYSSKERKHNNIGLIEFIYRDDVNNFEVSGGNSNLVGSLSVKQKGETEEESSYVQEPTERPDPLPSPFVEYSSSTSSRRDKFNIFSGSKHPLFWCRKVSVLVAEGITYNEKRRTMSRGVRPHPYIPYEGADPPYAIVCDNFYEEEFSRTEKYPTQQWKELRTQSVATQTYSPVSYGTEEYYSDNLSFSIGTVEDNSNYFNSTYNWSANPQPNGNGDLPPCDIISGRGLNLAYGQQRPDNLWQTWRFEFP